LLVSDLGLRHIGELRGVEISGVTVMTREGQPGDLFVALRGANRHGAEFVAEVEGFQSADLVDGEAWDGGVGVENDGHRNTFGV
jgi:UDP-N-acetylmuramyl pentapeptide synthase